MILGTENIVRIFWIERVNIAAPLYTRIRFESRSGTRAVLHEGLRCFLQPLLTSAGLVARLD
jgi:hypothetical protein